MAKHERKNTEKRPPMYYIATALMILALFGVLFFAGRQLIPYFRARQLENSVPKPAFSAAVRQPDQNTGPPPGRPISAEKGFGFFAT